MGMSQLPDDFKDFVGPYVGGGGPTKAFLRYCRSEVFHAQWEIILDSDFVIAYRHGMVVECLDGVIRRFYPRIFTYSADYPEK
jgi:Plavaka transposase